jgi:hypothetical protein
MNGDGEAGIMTKIRAGEQTKIDSIAGRRRGVFSKKKNLAVS